MDALSDCHLLLTCADTKAEKLAQIRIVALSFLLNLFYLSVFGSFERGVSRYPILILYPSFSAQSLEFQVFLINTHLHCHR